MADFTPDILSQILAGKVAPPAPPPTAPQPIIDPRFGRRAIPIQDQMMGAAIPNPSPNPTPIASGPGVAAPATPIISGPGDMVAPPAPAPNLTPAMPSPDLNVPGGEASHIIAPDANTPERINANKTLNTPAPTYADNKPKWWERLLGGAAAGMMAYGHMPNAVEVGQGVTDRRFNTATGAWDTNQAQARGVLNEQDKQFSNLTKLYGDTLQNAYHRDQLAEREQHGKDITAVRQQLANAQDERNAMNRDKMDNKLPKTWQEAQSMASAEKDPVEKKRLNDLYISMRNDEIAMRKSGKDNSIAEDRMEERRTKNLDSVQKDADNAVKAHKAKIQARIDKLDDTDPGYKSKIAQIERDDYAGMNSIGQQFASRSSRFGAKFEAPKPEPWEESNLSDSERQKLLGGTAKSQPKTKSAPEGDSQKFPLQESGGHKAGDVVTLKDGSRVKITGFNKNGQFSHVPAGN